MRIKVFLQVRNLFSVEGGECALWAGFADDEKNMLQKLLAKADEVIAQDDVYGLRNALQSVFQQLAPLIKKQIEERLPPLKNEYEEFEGILAKYNAESKNEYEAYWATQFESLFEHNDVIEEYHCSLFSFEDVLKLDPKCFYISYKILY